MPPGTHSLSLEEVQFSDPNQYALRYEPKATLLKVKQTEKGRDGLYGLGKHGEERYCVKCVEQMLEERRRKLRSENLQTVFLPGHPVFEVAYWIIGDRRINLNRKGKFTLRSFKIYGVELWKARWLWNRRDANPNYHPKNTPGRVEFIKYLPGRYPKAIFLQPEDRNYRGLYEDNTVGEISSDEVDDCSLSEVLERLDARAVAHEQLKAQIKTEQELAAKSAADARRAELHEKAERQKKWEEKEKASVVYRPRPRTVPIVRCSTPTPPPESPKRAPSRSTLSGEQSTSQKQPLDTAATDSASLEKPPAVIIKPA